MENFTLITIFVLFAVVVILYILYKCKDEKLTAMQLKNDELQHALDITEAENSKLNKALKTISKNRKEADEKIDELYNGDSVSNAIDGLCKH